MLNCYTNKKPQTTNPGFAFEFNQPLISLALETRYKKVPGESALLDETDFEIRLAVGEGNHTISFTEIKNSEEASQEMQPGQNP